MMPAVVDGPARYGRTVEDLLRAAQQPRPLLRRRLDSVGL
jgi:hypothetical protein